MNLLVNESTRRPCQPLCQDPWTPGTVLGSVMIVGGLVVVVTMSPSHG